MSAFSRRRHLSVVGLLKILIFFNAAGMAADPAPRYPEERRGDGYVHESRYHVFFPLQKGGEKLDVLVRVEETNRAYGFYLIFVEQRSWPMERKEKLRGLYEGWIGGEDHSVPYPVRVHLGVDLVDGSKNVHVDQIITERSPRFGRYVNNDTEIWLSQTLYLDGLPAGVYRVRLENLAPVPQIDFEVLFGFEKDTRKY